MRPKEELIQQSQLLVTHELKRRLGEAEKRLPCNCTHNHRERYDTREFLGRDAAGDLLPNPNYHKISRNGNETVGLCMFGAKDWQGNVCDEPEDAAACPMFKSKQTEEKVLAQAREDLRDPSWIEAHMPGLSALLWALNLNAPPKLSWAQRLWFRIRPWTPATVLRSDPYDVDRLVSLLAPVLPETTVEELQAKLDPQAALSDTPTPTPTDTPTP